MVNLEISLLAVDCSCITTLGISFAKGYGVVPMAKLAILESSLAKKKSIKSVSNSNGPKIDPWVTPESILHLSL